jgi:hypothetical protein
MLIRGTLVSFDSTAWTAVVRADGSAAQTLTGIRVSRAIPSGEMVAGRRVLVAAGEHGDVGDLVVVAAWT